jgi:hypothetical protein
VHRGPGGLLLVAALIAAPFGLAACGGRAAIPSAAQGSAARTDATSPTGSTQTLGGSTGPGGMPSAAGTGPTLPTLPAHTPTPSSSGAPAPRTTVPTSASPQTEITNAYETYLYDLSGLDDTLSRAYIGPLASVTTSRLAQASVRQAAAILDAQEHGVGTLRDDHLSIKITGPASAALVDCQDEEDFYLVSDDSGAPDAFVERGYFVGSAQMVLEDGHWLVDVFTTTHDECNF